MGLKTIVVQISPQIAVNMTQAFVSSFAHDAVVAGGASVVLPLGTITTPNLLVAKSLSEIELTGLSMRLAGGSEDIPIAPIGLCMDTLGFACSTISLHNTGGTEVVIRVYAQE